jgi:hypothetical protein
VAVAAATAAPSRAALSSSNDHGPLPGPALPRGADLLARLERLKRLGDEALEMRRALTAEGPRLQSAQLSEGALEIR